VGKDITRFQPGDAVFGDLTQFGHSAFAEYAIAPERAWAQKPSSMSYEEAATLPQAAILALQGLRGRGGIAQGNRVLINGASGSVGPFAVQIAKPFGAHVTGVCSPKKMDMVRSLGADKVIDYTREDYTRGGQRYDRIVDVAGNRSIFQCRRALKPSGVYVLLGGCTSRICVCLFLGPLITLAERKKMGFLWWKPFRKEDVAFLKGLIEAGKIKPVVDRTYPLSEVRSRIFVYSLLPLIIAIGQVGLDKSSRGRERKIETFLLYLFGIGVAGGGIGGFFGHFFISDSVAESIGWPTRESLSA
jgi:NADPH:quinone reductase-like Zn-dependent oxidoreductase